jgi:hypothetical protein
MGMEATVGAGPEHSIPPDTDTPIVFSRKGRFADITPREKSREVYVCTYFVDGAIVTHSE